MLISLNIQNVVLIARLTIDFKDGLCALTGETGAGKSILLDSLGLALGDRSETRLVRKGATQAQVSAEFQLPKNHEACKILKVADLEPEDSLILRRIVTSDGKSRAFINDTPVSAATLREIGETLIEIHGQFETHGLLNPSTHGALLDDYAQIDTDIADRFAEWKNAEKKLNQMRSDAERLRSEEDFLRRAIEDLDELNPQAGEEESLKSLRERLIHRENVLENLNAAYATLSTEEDPVRKSWTILTRIAPKLGTRGETILAALNRANVEMQEAAAGIETLSAELQDSEHNLQTIDDRLFGLRAQSRKHACAIDDLAAKRNELAEQLNLIEHGDDLIAAQMKKLDAAKKSYTTEAQKLSAARIKSADKLGKLVQKELLPLKLDKAKFVAQVETLPEPEWNASGIDRIRFLVATNPGTPPGPLNKIASGGEMARFMLALKVVMAETGNAQTLIFDEVDAGVGGAVADAVGERLAKLAKGKQILVVTHAPQIAARASHHWIVSKSGVKEVKTTVIPLESQSERREEIARMLSGAKVTQEARAAADKLLETGT